MAEEGSPSPVGSQAGAAAFDGATIALRMVAAAEAAASAAQAATDAVGRMRPRDSDDGKSWWRLLPKHAVFDHATRESEIAAWRDWSWSFEQYIASVDAKFLEDIQQVRDHPERAVDVVDFTDEEKQRNSFLYSLLSVNVLSWW